MVYTKVCLTILITMQTNIQVVATSSYQSTIYSLRSYETCHHEAVQQVAALQPFAIMTVWLSPSKRTPS